MIEQWNGDMLKTQIKDATEQNVSRAILFLQSKLRDTISIANPRGEEPSAPGEPPRRVTGTLADNVLVELLKNPTVGRVGLGRLALYGIALEIGAGPVEARPWIRFTWEKYKRQTMLLASGGRQ